MFQIAIVDDRAEDAEALARMVRACRRSSEACATGEGISTLNPLPFSFSAFSFSDGLNTSRRNPAHSRQKSG